VHASKYNQTCQDEAHLIKLSFPIFLVVYLFQQNITFIYLPIFFSQYIHNYHLAFYPVFHYSLFLSIYSNQIIELGKIYMKLTFLFMITTHSRSKSFNEHFIFYNIDKMNSIYLTF